MNRILQRIGDAGAVAWVRFVQVLNWLALTLAGLAVAFNAMYPQAVSEAAAALPPIGKLAVLAIWAGLVHFGLRRAAKVA